MNAATRRVLVAAATKHGATHEIAEALARDLRSASGNALDVDCVAVRWDPSPARYDAVVLGSAVYAGSWRDEARSWATTHAAELRERPVWLFSSGPIGEPPFPPDEPHDVAALMRVIGARAHRTFPGRLDKALLSVPERAMVTAMRAPLGDFRDWAAVQKWATEIAGSLAVPASSGAER
jgi:menaquinone-dependent protoporphyrinogen oxidase